MKQPLNAFRGEYSPPHFLSDAPVLLFKPCNAISHPVAEILIDAVGFVLVRYALVLRKEELIPNTTLLRRELRKLLCSRTLNYLF